TDSDALAQMVAGKALVALVEALVEEGRLLRHEGNQVEEAVLVKLTITGEGKWEEDSDMGERRRSHQDADQVVVEEEAGTPEEREYTTLRQEQAANQRRLEAFR